MKLRHVLVHFQARILDVGVSLHPPIVGAQKDCPSLASIFVVCHVRYVSE